MSREYWTHKYNMIRKARIYGLSSPEHEHLLDKMERECEEALEEEARRRRSSACAKD